MLVIFGSVLLSGFWMYIVRRKNSLLNDCSNSFAICYTTIFAGDLGVDAISKLLLHVLTSLEDVKHTMRSHIVRRKNSLLNDCSNSFAICYTTIFAGDLGVDAISKLLLHVLTSLEDVKHTMRSHSTMLPVKYLLVLISHRRLAVMSTMLRQS
jgi:hypothetical protein